ncbi:MAG TPA: hypothetical protein DIT25_00945 [Candidatus Moranbacteria bacterium]|nr:hypothetical protein [Candidatus Moranbacteria bacterium]
MSKKSQKEITPAKSKEPSQSGIKRFAHPVRVDVMIGSRMALGIDPESKDVLLKKGGSSSDTYTVAMSDIMADSKERLLTAAQQLI